jgi:hypothetical protein
LSNFDGLVLSAAFVLTVCGIAICGFAFLSDYLGRRRRSRLMRRPRLQEALEYVAVPEVVLVRPPLRDRSSSPGRSRQNGGALPAAAMSSI